MNLCSCSSPYSLNCHIGTMLVFRMLCRITQSIKSAQNWVSISDGSRTDIGQWEWVPVCWARNSKTSLAVFRSSAAWNCKVTPRSWTECIALYRRLRRRPTITIIINITVVVIVITLSYDNQWKTSVIGIKMFPHLTSDDDLQTFFYFVKIKRKAKVHYICSWKRCFC